ncbi:MAG: copper resistance protein CopC [Hyphomicrobiales bacterium]|nr:copper resistance protein CopC [Hyphomicrobiales bacterium]
MSKRLAVIAYVVLGFVIGIGAAGAHAHLDRASPAPESTVRTAPNEVTLWFTQKLEPSLSLAQVQNSSGARVDRGARVDEADPTLLHVTLMPLPPGTYKVHWQVVSVDTHRTEGDFSFRVGG